MQEKLWDMMNNQGLAGEQLSRTLTSHFRVALYERFGGRVWFKILVAIGDVPTELLDYVNEHNAIQIREAGREPSLSEPIEGAKLSKRNLAARKGESVPPRTGVQHKSSHAKDLRKEARSLDWKIAEERQRWKKNNLCMGWRQWNDLLQKREADIYTPIYTHTSTYIDMCVRVRIHIIIHMHISIYTYVCTLFGRGGMGRSREGILVIWPSLQ